MKKIFVINGHQYYPFAEGKLNKTFEEKAAEIFKKEGYEIKKTTTEKAYNIDEEIEKFQWADVIFVQAPR